ncbi:hypothetical protein [Streptomyces sp. CBMA156]|nr:hypothetical protein [Streptomyces sp. CBMA156]
MHPTERQPYEEITPDEWLAIDASFTELGEHIRSLRSTDEADAGTPEVEQ